MDSRSQRLYLNDKTYVVIDDYDSSKQYPNSNITLLFSLIWISLVLLSSDPERWWTKTVLMLYPEAIEMDIVLHINDSLKGTLNRINERQEPMKHLSRICSLTFWGKREWQMSLSLKQDYFLTSSSWAGYPKWNATSKPIKKQREGSLGPTL
jgi:hypothetical protein